MCLLFCRDNILKFDKNKKFTLDEDLVNKISGTMRKAAVDMMVRRNNSHTKDANRGVNMYRTQFNSLCRSVWKQLPNIDQIKKGSYRKYRCSDKCYDDVVLEVATVIHEFLFCGKTVMKFDAYPSDYTVEFPTVHGNVISCI